MSSQAHPLDAPPPSLHLIDTAQADNLTAATTAAAAGKLQAIDGQLAIDFGGPVWLRMDIPVGSANCRPDCWIETGPAFLNHIQAFVPAADGSYLRYDGGSMENATSPIPYRNFIVPVGATAMVDVVTVYFRIATDTPRTFYAKLSTPSEFAARAAWDNAIIGLLVGGLCLIGIWGLIHSIWLRERLYLLVALYIAGTTLVYALVLGLLKPWLPIDAFNIALACSIALAIGLYAEVLHIAPVERHMPRLYTVFRLLSWSAAAILVLLAFIGHFSLLAPGARYLLLAQNLFALFVTATLSRRGERSARYCLAAFLLHSCQIIALLANHSIAHSNVPLCVTSCCSLFSDTSFSSRLPSLLACVPIESIAMRCNEPCWPICWRPRNDCAA